MKNILPFLFFLFGANQLYAQQVSIPDDLNSGTAIVEHATKFEITQPLNKIFSQDEIDQMDFKEAKEMPDREHRITQKFLFTPNDGAQYGNDPSSIQSSMGKGKKFNGY